jgi:hypothetical protein
LINQKYNLVVALYFNIHLLLSYQSCNFGEMKIFGQDLGVIKNQLIALFLNILNWFLSYIPFPLRSLKVPELSSASRVCVSIPSPGGLDKLVITELVTNGNSRQVTIGYNIPNMKPPIVTLNDLSSLSPDLVLVRVKYFSINYADIAIRWGLYESALRYVGWPIVPGFDFSGEIEWAGAQTPFSPGEKVFGFSLFGAYSTNVLVPGSQLRKLPNCSIEEAAALPAGKLG